jgi:hypothetical protein
VEYEGCSRSEAIVAGRGVRDSRSLLRVVVPASFSGRRNVLEEDQFQHQSSKGSENAACEKVEHCVHFSLDARFDSSRLELAMAGLHLPVESLDSVGRRQRSERGSVHAKSEVSGEERGAGGGRRRRRRRDDELGDDCSSLGSDAAGYGTVDMPSLGEPDS